MADLNAVDRKILEALLGMDAGYVLDFTDATFSEFFADFNIDINSHKYRVIGSSKAKRMRGFWKIENNHTVGEVLNGLYRYIQAVAPQGAPKVDSIHADISARLLGESTELSEINASNKKFLEIEFGDIDISLSLSITIRSFFMCPA